MPSYERLNDAEDRAEGTPNLSYFHGESGEDGPSIYHCNRGSKKARALAIATIIFLCVGMFTLNIYQWLELRQLRESSIQHRHTEMHSQGGHWRQYKTWTEFSSADNLVNDAAWATLQTNGFVAVPHQWAAQQQLPTAEDWPNDPSKGVYVVDGFHQLHCVMYLRTQMSLLINGEPVDDHVYHLRHCYDYLRQSIQCRADDTLLYLAPNNNLTAGDGQVRWCRDWDALENWARARSACWPTGRCK